MNTYYKSALSSKTIWGGLISIFPSVWDILLQSLPSISEGVDVVVASGALPPQTSAIISAIGGLIAIFGRVKAEGKIAGIK